MSQQWAHDCAFTTPPEWLVVLARTLFNVYLEVVKPNTWTQPCYRQSPLGASAACITPIPVPSTTLGQLALHPAYLYNGSTSMLSNSTLMPLVPLHTVKPHTGGARVCMCVCVCVCGVGVCGVGGVCACVYGWVCVFWPKSH